MLRYLDDQTLVDKYLELKEQKKLIEAMIDKIKPELTAAVLEEDEGKYQHGDYLFTTSFRKTYSYPEDLCPEVAEVTAELKALQGNAKREGRCSLKTSAVLTVKFNPQREAIR